MRWWLVLLAACPSEEPQRELGVACDYEYQCASNRCVANRCESEQVSQQKMLEQSGVTAPVEAPRGDTTSAPVRLRSAKGSTPVFAACAQDERLVGGGCSGGTNCNGGNCDMRSYPTSLEAADTIAGRWMCENARGEVTARALCQRIR